MEVVLNMIDGNVNEFVDHIQYGDELWFIYDNKKYFLEGLPENGVCKLFFYEMVEGGKECSWNGDADNYPVNSFLEAPIFNGKTRHLHMKAMNHDIHSLFCTLYLDISLFLANILLIV